MTPNRYLYLYTTPDDPPNWLLGTQIYRAIGQIFECLLERAEGTTVILIVSILALGIWKQEMCVVLIVGIVAVCFREWTFVFTFIFQVSSIILAVAGIVNLVLWKLFLKGVWGQVCHGRRAIGSFISEAPGQIFGALAGWYGWYDIGLVATRPLGWVEYIGLRITHLCELPVTYRKWVSEHRDRVLAWAQTPISYFSRKPHEVAERNDKEDITITTYSPESTAPTKPTVVRLMHCTGSTSTDYVNPYPSWQSSRDLLLPESYPLPAAVAPDTPTTQQLLDADPFRTPVPLRAGDPGFLNPHPNSEDGPRDEKPFTEKEREILENARTRGSKGPRLLRKFKPGRGSEPGFLDAYPYPYPMPRKRFERDVGGHFEWDGSVGSINPRERNEPHVNHSNKLAITDADGRSIAESSTAESDADVGEHEKVSETSINSADSKETTELCSCDRTIEVATGVVTSSGEDVYQGYFTQPRIVDANRQDTTVNKIDAMDTRATRPAKGHSRDEEPQPGSKRIRY
ncbi:hypothetical protein HOY82DRAFT_670609 [Tuber indicum]|nr:hypothetical protein HOY82DRAFT_670609 [Tuber indicum]